MKQIINTVNFVIFIILSLGLNYTEEACIGKEPILRLELLLTTASFDFDCAAIPPTIKDCRSFGSVQCKISYDENGCFSSCQCTKHQI